MNRLVRGDNPSQWNAAKISAQTNDAANRLDSANWKRVGGGQDMEFLASTFPGERGPCYLTPLFEAVQSRRQVVTMFFEHCEQGNDGGADGDARQPKDPHMPAVPGGMKLDDA